MDSFNRLLISVTTRVAKLDINDDSRQKIKRFFFLDFVDQMDRAFSFQSLPKLDLKMYSMSFSNYMKEHNALFRSSQTTGNLLTRAAMIFQNITPSNSISSNINLCLEALHLLEGHDDRYAALAIAMSGNQAVIGFSFFLETYLNNTAIQRIVMNGNEQVVNTIFINATRSLQKYHGRHLLISQKRRCGSAVDLVGSTK